MRIFLDANVLFSATYATDSPLLAFFDLADIGLCELLVSPFVLDEVRRNIARKKPSHMAHLEQLVARVTVCKEAGAENVHWALSTGLPDKDAPILAAAALAKADILVTGDRTHFGNHYKEEFLGVSVLTPKIALERILATRD